MKLDRGDLSCSARKAIDLPSRATPLTIRRRICCFVQAGIPLPRIDIVGCSKLSMFGIRRQILVALAVSTLSIAPRSEALAADSEPRDYQQLIHTLQVSSLRAGNHDPSGVNDYYFVATMYGLLNSSEERNLPLDKRKQLVVDLGSFGDTQIEALKAWQHDDKAQNPKQLRIEGNAIRELTARTMTEFNVAEADVAVMVEVALWERAKRFVFFGEDYKVGKVDYFPVPQTTFEQAASLRVDTTLTISDDKGTLVKLAVTYDNPARPAVKNAEKAAAGG